MELTKAEAVFQNGTVFISEEILVFYDCLYNVYDSSGLVYIKSGNTLAVFQCGDGNYYINGDKKQFAPSYMSAGKLYVPAYLVCVLANKNYTYLSDGNIINFISNDSSDIDGIASDESVLGEELLECPDFEDDFVSAGAYTNRYHVGSLVWEHDVVHDGIGSAALIERVSPWDSIGQDIASMLDIKGSGKYEVSGWIKMADSDYTMHGRLYTKNEHNEYETNFSFKIDAKVDEWTYFNQTIDISVGDSISEAYFYIESSNTDDAKADRQAFYLDDLSLKKYGDVDSATTGAVELTEEEKAFIAEMQNKLSETETVITYPRESTEFLRNPFKGFINYKFTTDSVASTPAAQISSIMLARTEWSVVEPEEGKFDWSFIDERRELAKKYGMQLSIGFQCAYNNKGSMTSGNIVKQATPLWVFDKGCKYTVTYGWGQTALVPVWDDPVYLEEQQKFVDAILERYNDDPYIASIDMRSYGNWGEFHVGGLESRDGTDDSQPIGFEAMKKHIDLWKNARIPLNCFVANKNAYEYAIETYGTGIRMDGVMRVSSSDFKKLLAVEGKAQAVAEWLEPAYKGFMPGGKWEKNAQDVPVMFEQLFDIAKVSVCSLANFGVDEFYKDYPRLCNYWANRIGYWFKPVEIEYPKDITKGVLRIKMKNDGVAPIYAGNNNSSNVKLALLDGNRNVLKTVKLDTIDMFEWKPGVYTESYGEYDFGDVSGAEYLALGLFSNDTVETPNIKLGMVCDSSDGWYILDSLPHQESEILSENCIYTASKTAATASYGYHHPDHAFDGDSETYWSLEWAKDGWLEIDFGKDKKVSQITINSQSDCNAKYSIEGFVNGEWVELANRTTLKSGDTTILFKKKVVSKVRIHVTEMSIDEKFIINELTVK